MAAKNRSTDLGAGLNLSKAQIGLDHPAGSSQHGTLGQAERAFSAASTFLSGILAISASQFIGAPLRFVDSKLYASYMASTKESFAVLVSTMTQLWAPTVVRVTGDDSMRDQLYQMQDGSLRCNFPHRLVMMANHQLYTDWLYLWWIAYTNKMHGRIYIILKESLKNVPIFGWSAQFYNFIFLARKWETDRPRFKRSLQHLSNPLDPMWLLIFPEGTNLSASTREGSKAWAEKNGIPDMKHQLLPRSTGLQFCLQELKATTNWLYDCTIAYEGVPAGQFGQDIFTLRSSLFEGRPPKSVNMYWRRWRIADLPIEDTEAFSMWLKNRWTEKDHLLEHYARHGTFPDGDPVRAMKAEDTLIRFAKQQGKSTNIRPVAKSAKWITTEVRAGGMEEFMGIFSPIASAATAISSGQLSPENIDLDAIMARVAAQQSAQLGQGGAPFPIPAFASAFLPASRPQGHASSKIEKGRMLPPPVRQAIDAAHAQAQARIAAAGNSRKPQDTAVGRTLPRARNAAPMTPVNTLVTRPITSLAVSRGAKALGTLVDSGRRGSPKVRVSEKESDAEVTAVPGPAVGGTNLTRATGAATKTANPSDGTSVVGRPAAKRSDSATGSSVVSSGGASVDRKVHPLSGKRITRAEWERRQQTRQTPQEKS